MDTLSASTKKASDEIACAEIKRLITEIERILASTKEQCYVIYHDAFGYFENDINLPASTAANPGDSSSDGPARIAVTQSIIEE